MSNPSSGNSNGGQTVFIPAIPSGGGWFTITIGGGGGGGGGRASGNYDLVHSEKKKDKDGCDCKKCREFYPYAEPNQEDGTLICFACRHGY
jgi:hypothetical protein